MEVYIVWMTSVFFLSAECENYPWKRGDKVRGKKIVFELPTPEKGRKMLSHQKFLPGSSL